MFGGEADFLFLTALDGMSAVFGGSGNVGMVEGRGSGAFRLVVAGSLDLIVCISACAGFQKAASSVLGKLTYRKVLCEISQNR